MGAFPSHSDGTVEVDSNTGSLEELQAEFAAELPADQKAKAGSEPAAKAGDEPEESSQEAEEPGVTEAAQVAKAAPGEPAKKPKKSLQRRIDEVRAEAGQTARERDAARQRIAELEAQLATQKNGGKPGEYQGVPLSAERFPKFVDWLKIHPDGDVDDWVEDRDGWKEARAQASTARETAGRAQQESRSAAFEHVSRGYAERMAPVLEKNPNFYESIDDRLLNTKAESALPPGVVPTFGNFLVEQVLQSDVPDALLVHLSKPATIRAYAGLPRTQILRKIAQFELSHRPAGASTGPSAESDDSDEELSRTQRYTAADPPIKPVRGSSQVAAGEEPGDDASDDEWLRYQRAKTRRQRSA